MRLVESVCLRVMRLEILRRILDAEKSGHADFFEGSVVASRHPPLAQFEQSQRAQWRDHLIHYFAILIIPHQADADHPAGANVVNQRRGKFRQFILVRFDVGARSVQALLFAGK